MERNRGPFANDYSNTCYIPATFGPSQDEDDSVGRFSGTLPVSHGYNTVVAGFNERVCLSV